MITGVLPAFLTASLASRIPDDFAFGDSRLGLAIAVFHVMCALTSTPAGRLVERIGAVRGMRLAAIATAISCLAIAALAQSAVSLTALLLIGGLANALGGPSVSALLKHEVAVHRHGLAFGAQNSGASLGALLAGLALPAVAIPFGWRWAFVLVAGLALAAAALAPAGDGEDRAAAGPPARAEHRARAGGGGRAGQRGRRRLRLVPRALRGRERHEPGGGRAAAGRREPGRDRQPGRRRRRRRPARPGAAAAGGGDARRQHRRLPAADRRRAGADRGGRAAGGQLRLGVAGRAHAGRRAAQPGARRRGRSAC